MQKGGKFYGYNEEYGFPEGSEIYRRSFIGIALLETLDALCDNESVIFQAMRTFDKIIKSNCEALPDNLLTVTGKITRSRGLEGVWQFNVKDCVIKEIGTNLVFRSDAITIWTAEKYAMESFSGDGRDPNLFQDPESLWGGTLPFWIRESERLQELEAHLESFNPKLTVTDGGKTTEEGKSDSSEKSGVDGGSDALKEVTIAGPPE